ncbi:MAG: FAD-dependent oxidoreductase [Chloroflexi bacterium]|nr:FAD-dependent oxidoreductase [Chloroflexota bacterium]
MPIGTESTPLRVAIIGSGPSAFYAAEALQKQSDLVVEIDMFERLPTPFGLVRGGVAPDHAKIKSVTRVYDRIATRPNFRFYGNVTFGRDVTRADLVQHYHAILYAVGAQTDRHLGIPGENLPGNHAATEFVGWYNAHPDFCDRRFDLSHERIAVIGNGNVAMDVVRILARSTEELYETDIADHALEALKHSGIKEIVVLGRRGPAQASFTNPELKELGELSEAEVIVPPDEIELDPLSRAYLLENTDRTASRNVEILSQFASLPPQGKPKKIIMRFLVSPVEIIGTDRVEALKIVKNELYRRADGTLRPHATEQYETIPVGLIFRSIGYHGVELPNVPFDQRTGTIPNDHGRVLNSERRPIPGEYVAGWIKRGPTGIIGTNKPDAQETVGLLLADAASGQVLHPARPDRQALEDLLSARQVNYVTYADWQIIEQLEQMRGQAVGRPCLKFSHVAEMLAALEAHKQATAMEPRG